MFTLFPRKQHILPNELDNLNASFCEAHWRINVAVSLETIGRLQKMTNKCCVLITDTKLKLSTWWSAVSPSTLAWLMSAPCRSSAATSSRSPAEQAAINTAPCANCTFARRVPEPPVVLRVSDPVRSVSEPSHRWSWSCRRCLAASDREWSVAAIFPLVCPRTDSAHGTRRRSSGVRCLDWAFSPPARAAPPGGRSLQLKPQTSLRTSTAAPWCLQGRLGIYLLQHKCINYAEVSFKFAASASALNKMFFLTTPSHLWSPIENN